MARVLVDPFIANYAQAPPRITLAMDHTDNAIYGQQALSCYNHHYGRHYVLPLLVFEADSGASLLPCCAQAKHLAALRTP